jgi:hypothetical protein
VAPAGSVRSNRMYRPLVGSAACWNNPTQGPLTAFGLRVDSCMATAIAIAVARRVSRICWVTPVMMPAILICSLLRVTPPRSPPVAVFTSGTSGTAGPAWPAGPVVTVQL